MSTPPARAFLLEPPIPDIQQGHRPSSRRSLEPLLNIGLATLNSLPHKVHESVSQHSTDHTREENDMNALSAPTTHSPVAVTHAERISWALSRTPRTLGFVSPIKPRFEGYVHTGHIAMDYLTHPTGSPLMERDLFTFPEKPRSAELKPLPMLRGGGSRYHWAEQEDERHFGGPCLTDYPDSSSSSDAENEADSDVNLQWIPSFGERIKQPMEIYHSVRGGPDSIQDTGIESLTMPSYLGTHIDAKAIEQNAWISQIDSVEILSRGIDAARVIHALWGPVRSLDPRYEDIQGSGLTRPDSSHVLEWVSNLGGFDAVEVDDARSDGLSLSLRDGTERTLAAADVVLADLLDDDEQNMLMENHQDSSHDKYGSEPASSLEISSLHGPHTSRSTHSPIGSSSSEDIDDQLLFSTPNIAIENMVTSRSTSKIRRRLSAKSQSRFQPMREWTPLRAVHPSKHTLYNIAREMSIRDLASLNWGSKVDITSGSTGEVFARQVPKRMLVHFCGIELIDAMTIGCFNGSQNIEIPDSKVESNGVTKVIRYLRRWCSPRASHPTSELRIPSDVRAGVETTLACRVFGFDADAERIEDLVVYTYMGSKDWFMTDEHIELIWGEYDGRASDTSMGDAIVWFILNDVQSSKSPLEEEIRWLLQQESYAALKQRVTAEVMSKQWKKESRSKFLHRSRKERNKRLEQERRRVRDQDAQEGRLRLWRAERAKLISSKKLTVETGGAVYENESDGSDCSGASIRSDKAVYRQPYQSDSSLTLSESSAVSDSITTEADEATGSNNASTPRLTAGRGHMVNPQEQAKSTCARRKPEIRENYSVHGIGSSKTVLLELFDQGPLASAPGSPAPISHPKRSSSLRAPTSRKPLPKLPIEVEKQVSQQVNEDPVKFDRRVDDLPTMSSSMRVEGVTTTCYANHKPQQPSMRGEGIVRTQSEDRRSSASNVPGHARRTKSSNFLKRYFSEE